MPASDSLYGNEPSTADKRIKAGKTRVLLTVFEEYETHLQRLRPLRTAMEERLLRAFAGLINQLRQQDLGIERYIWRSRDDSKVRDSHAEYDDQVFRWDEPPAGGHPGQAHNCRCYAEPVAPGLQNDVILAELALPADSFPSSGGIVRRLANGLLARSPAGMAAYAALEANNLLQGFVQSAREQRVRDAAAVLGADLGTVEGLLAAQSYAQALVLAENGFLSGSPERGERARVIAEALGLYEMYRPGLFTLPNENAGDAVNLARRLAVDALAALDAGRLVIDEGSLSQGWAEVFPGLTEDERRLGQLPGFTPERIEQWLETYPAEVLGLPNHTGSPAVEDPTGNTISTPIPDAAGPNVVTMENPHSIDSVSIPEDRARHILDGEGRSGGHRYGTGIPGKTEFPATWSDNDILEAIRQVAGTGTVDRPAHRDGDLVVVGEVNGVTIEVVVQPNGEVRTGYPLSGPGVRRN
ncbi:hypothetical protein EJA01_12660 [Rhodovulum iodosum]|nr:hypothetical protein EJA01_12660 [Rhodovulum robiginosum]